MKRSQRTLALTLIATFVLMSLLVAYTTRLMYNTSSSYILELGNDKTAAITADLENYLDTAKSVLWVTADTVDHMVTNGATNDEIVEYITRESTNTEAQFDESYTGLYGVIRGNYVDGVGWTPPEDYDPTIRDWYKTAMAAEGDAVIASPYVDAQTGKVIISVVKCLSNPQDVLGLDLTLSDIQNTVENISIDGNGYGFLLNYDGFVVAHHDPAESGKNYSDDPDKAELFAKVISVGKGNFEMDIDGRKCTVFVDEVLDQWHLVIVIESVSLLDDAKSILVVSVLISLLVFGLISTFYIIAHNHERKITRRMEEMKEIEHKKDYESKLLKLEKSAADSANKAKSNFLADMSHEIRTPINAVLGMNEMILRESKEEQTLEYASNIKSAGNTLLSIINDILDFSKIEDGKMSLVMVEFDVTEWVNGLVNSIQERARAKGLELKIDVDESVPSKLYGDDVRLTQVVVNLLTNAVKYTEKGSVTLRIRNTEIKDDNVCLRFDVIDTGIGIKSQDMDKLFMTFERIEEKRNRNIEGTGLGLSIVNKLLSMMDSKLDVSSRYGVGSSFSFSVSLKIVDKEPIGNYEERRKQLIMRSQNVEERLYAPKARVLIVDDNDMNLKVAKSFMKLFGIKPDTCSSGKETLDILKSRQYDIIFLDHMMPVLDGIETLRLAKDKNLVHDAVVIALTANAVVGAKEQYLKSGFNGYLSKPIVVKDIEKTLKKFLPEDIIEEAAPGTESSSSTTSITLDKVREIGLNTDAGIEYACGEEDLYLDLLSDYAKGCEDKCKELDSYLDKEDMKNYSILIHSLKSSSRIIGADAISAQAKDLEDASKKNDIDFVQLNHDNFKERYKSLAAKLLG